MVRIVFAVGALVTALVVHPLHMIAFTPVGGLRFPSPQYNAYALTSLLCFPVGVVAAWGIVWRMTRQQSLPFPFPRDWRITAGTCIFCLYWIASLFREAANNAWLGQSGWLMLLSVAELIGKLPVDLSGGQGLSLALILCGMTHVLLAPGTRAAN
jgi:hypothetical protein